MMTLGGRGDMAALVRGYLLRDCSLLCALSVGGGQ